MAEQHNILQVDIVSAEHEIFSGEAESVIVTGEMGELGIFPGHTALLTPLKPGEICLQHNNKEEIYYVSGGTMEVQPHLVTILADTVARADELDEVAAKAAKDRAENAMRDSKEQMNYAAAAIELAQALAQLRAIDRIKRR
jgi:F-type H+-transporting ATPase subunit epsilon